MTRSRPRTGAEGPAVPSDAAALLQEHLAQVRDSGIPQHAAAAWRAALAAETLPLRRTTSRRRGWLRAGAMAAAALAGAAVLVVALSAIFPAVALWAGSLPGVGVAFQRIGFTESLAMKYPPGLVATIDREVSGHGITLRVLELTADNQRTLITAEAIVPERYYERTETLSGSTVTRRFVMQLEDQWGHKSSDRSWPGYEAHDAGEGLVRLDMALEFAPVRFETRHLTLRLCAVDLTQWPEVKLEPLLAVRLPVDLRAAAAYVRTIRPGTSATVAGVTVTLEEVALGHTGTQATVRYTGLVPYGNLAPMLGYRSPNSGSIQTVREGADSIALELPPIRYRGEQALLIRLAPVEPVDLDFTLVPGGAASQEVYHGPEGLTLTIVGWSFAEGVLEARLLAAAHGSASMSHTFELAAGDQSFFVDCTSDNLETRPRLSASVRHSGTPSDHGEFTHVEGRGELLIQWHGLPEPPAVIRLVGRRTEYQLVLPFVVPQ